jgi:hypothetical protein
MLTKDINVIHKNLIIQNIIIKINKIEFDISIIQSNVNIGVIDARVNLAPK